MPRAGQLAGRAQRIVSSESSQSIDPAFARIARRAVLLAGVVAAVGFFVASQHLLHARAGNAALEKAELCAASLAPGVSGDLSDSVDRLRSRYDRLVAVATLSPSGDIQSIYTDHPAYRASAADVAHGDANPVAITTTLSGESVKLWGAVATLNGGHSPDAWRAVFLLRRDSLIGTCLTATVWFSVMLAAALGFCLGAVARRFKREIVAPLRLLAQFDEKRPFEADRWAAPDFGPYAEPNKIAENFRQHARVVKKNEARTRQAKYNAERQMRRREVRWDHRLRRAEDQAGIDPLTGLRNRRFLDREFEPLLEQQRTRNRDFAVIMIDIDNFKSLNDAYGHEAGDEVLCFLGELLQAAIRPGDHAVRYGGDEFLLLLPQVDAAHAAEIAERIVKLFGQYMSRYESTQSLAVSAGVASMKSDRCVSGVELIKKADHALYAAKRRGKSTVSLCTGT